MHILKNFYELYPATVMRFRQKLYAELASWVKEWSAVSSLTDFAEGQKGEQEREKRERA